jgi:hypothetical protein
MGHSRPCASLTQDHQCPLYAEGDRDSALPGNVAMGHFRTLLWISVGRAETSVRASVEPSIPVDCRR